RISDQFLDFARKIKYVWLLFPVSAKVESPRVRLLNKRNFPAAAPTLEFLLTRDRIIDVAKVLNPDKTVQMITPRETFHLCVPMLVQMAANIVCVPYIQSCAMLVRKNVHPVIVVEHPSQKRSEMFRFAQHDRIARFKLSTFLLAPLPAEFAHQLHRLINYFRRNIESRAHTDRIVAGTKCENTEVEETVPKFFAGFRVRQIESEKQSPAAGGGNQWLFRLQIAQLLEEIRADLRGVLNQTFLLDDAQIMGRAHHIGEVSTPGGIQAAG